MPVECVSYNIEDSYAVVVTTLSLQLWDSLLYNRIGISDHTQPAMRPQAKTFGCRSCLDFGDHIGEIFTSVGLTLTHCVALQPYNYPVLNMHICI